MVLTVNTVDIQYQCTMCDVDTTVFQHNINFEYKFIGFNLNPVLNLISMCNFQNSCQTSSSRGVKRQNGNKSMPYKTYLPRGLTQNNHGFQCSLAQIKNRYPLSELFGKKSVKTFNG